ncbi:MAG TPA: hypothetical protein VL576_00810 [Candidatus Paceibacterota bacterium]|jgi:hypothetical protein|nr:hypothetical protein [Candidatus Paceibacterota bacterium]
MKKALIVLYKIGFWFYFLFSTGVISGIIFLNTDKSKNNIYDHAYIPKEKISKEDDNEQWMKVNAYYDQLVDKASAKVAHGGLYSPYDYFGDMKRVITFREQRGYTMGISNFETLLGLMNKSIKTGGYSYDDVVKARANLFPEYREHKKEESIDWKLVRKWFLHLYLKMLPAVVILFLLWLYEDSDLRKLRMRSPIGFMLAVAFHPLILLISTIQWWRTVEMESAVRIRKKDFLSILSKDELAQLSRFAKGMITKAELHSMLKLEQKIIHHSFLVAVCITIILRCIPCLASTYHVYRDKREAIRVVTTQHDHYGQDCGAVSCTYTHHAPFIPIEAWVDDCATGLVYYARVTTQWLKECSLSLLRGFPQLVEPIPLRTTTFLPKKNSK